MTNERLLRTAVMLGVLLTAFATPVVANAKAADAGERTAAVWQPQIVKLEYRATSTIFMCRSLQRQVERILLQVGVRQRVQFRRFHCGNLSHFVSAEIALMAPLEATAANIHHLTEYDSRDVLVARVRGQRLPAATELKLFPAAWRTVPISGMRRNRGDCELLQQLRQQVLSKLSVRIVADSVQQCSTVFAPDVAPPLVVQALIAESADPVEYDSAWMTP